MNDFQLCEAGRGCSNMSDGGCWIHVLKAQISCRAFKRRDHAETSCHRIHSYG